MFHTSTSQDPIRIFFVLLGKHTYIIYRQSSNRDVWGLSSLTYLKPLESFASHVAPWVVIPGSQLQNHPRIVEIKTTRAAPAQRTLWTSSCKCIFNSISLIRPLTLRKQMHDDSCQHMFLHWLTERSVKLLHSPPASTFCFPRPRATAFVHQLSLHSGRNPPLWQILQIPQSH